MNGFSWSSSEMCNAENRKIIIFLRPYARKQTSICMLLNANVQINPNVSHSLRRHTHRPPTVRSWLSDIAHKTGKHFLNLASLNLIGWLHSTILQQTSRNKVKITKTHGWYSNHVWGKTTQWIYPGLPG